MWREIYITDEGSADAEGYARLIGLEEGDYRIEHEAWSESEDEDEEESWSVLVKQRRKINETND